MLKRTDLPVGPAAAHFANRPHDLIRHEGFRLDLPDQSDVPFQGNPAGAILSHLLLHL